MQAWNQVKVTNQDSEYAGRAGVVVRVEAKGDQRLVFVNLDATDDKPQEIVEFADKELQILG